MYALILKIFTKQGLVFLVEMANGEDPILLLEASDSIVQELFDGARDVLHNIDVYGDVVGIRCSEIAAVVARIEKVEGQEEEVLH